MPEKPSASKERTIHQWKVGPSVFQGLPEAGARLMDWNWNHRPIIHWPQEANLDQVARVRGGNPILFPFCARTYEAGELGFWRHEDGVRRPMPMHGFARQGRFRVLQLGEAGFEAQLLPTPEDRLAYPFNYDFRVNYQFRPDGLDVRLSLRNLGPSPIPWSAGHHFYFAIPWRPEGARADYELQAPCRAWAKQSTDGSLEQQPARGRTASLSDPNLIERIHLGPETAFLRDRVDGSALRMEMFRTPPGDGREEALVAWTENETSPFYCVEPWMGPPNAPGHQKGLDRVPTGETHHFGVSLTWISAEDHGQ